MNQMKVILVALIAFAVAGCSDDSEPQVSAKQEKAIAERLAPAGEVALEGETGSTATTSASSEPRSGEEVYNTKCLACHATGAGGAPMIGKADQWSPRIAQGIETLYTHAIEGVRGMPAKGLCMDCSDEEIKASVDYLVNNSQ